MSKRIVLNARLESDLDWKKEAIEAEGTDRVIWQLELGLFDELRHTLDHEGQFKSLCLSLQHFREEIWERFSEKTQAVVLYTGSPEFGEVEAEFLELLTTALPMDCVPTIELDCTAVADPVHSAMLVSKERFPEFKVEVTGFPGYDSASSVGILLPSQDEKEVKLLNPLFQKLEKFRVIPESDLTMEWHGLDELHYVESLLTPLGRRKLQGFQAAGGKLHT